MLSLESELERLCLDVDESSPIGGSFDFHSDQEDETWEEKERDGDEEKDDEEKGDDDVLGIGGWNPEYTNEVVRMRIQHLVRPIKQFLMNQKRRNPPLLCGFSDENITRVYSISFQKLYIPREVHGGLIRNGKQNFVAIIDDIEIVSKLFPSPTMDSDLFHFEDPRDCGDFVRFIQKYLF